jgi:hypothetical protein
VNAPFSKEPIRGNFKHCDHSLGEFVPNGSGWSMKIQQMILLIPTEIWNRFNWLNQKGMEGEAGIGLDEIVSNH